MPVFEYFDYICTQKCSVPDVPRRVSDVCQQSGGGMGVAPLVYIHS